MRQVTRVIELSPRFLEIGLQLEDSRKTLSMHPLLKSSVRLNRQQFVRGLRRHDVGYYLKAGSVF